MSQPRILFVDHTGRLGGAELYLLDVARHFRADCRVTLLEDGPFADRLQAADVPVEVLPAPDALLDTQASDGWASVAQAVPGLVRTARRLRARAQAFDVVVANSQKALFVAGAAGWLAGRPVVWNLHDMLTARHFSPPARRLSALGGRLLADRVIVNSHATRAALAEAGGPEDAAVVYNGIDPAPFDAVSDAEAQAVRRDLGIPEARLVGMFGRLAPWKGQHVVLHALAQRPGTHALFVGESLFRGDAPYADRLRRQARSLGIEERTHFLGFREDVPVLMQAVDAVVHASTEPEPFGRVIVEGMLARTPVVAARAGGAREIVEDGTTGLLTPPGDAEGLADALRRLAARPKRAEAMAAAGRRRAQECFSVDAMVQQVGAVVRAAA